MFFLNCRRQKLVIKNYYRNNDFIKRGVEIIIILLQNKYNGCKLKKLIIKNYNN
jgi:hypothetical protein